MTPREVAALLAYIARLDPRTALPNEVEATARLDQWRELLATVPAETNTGWNAAAVARDHIAESPFPILPADIARRWAAHKRAQLDRHTDPTPGTDPDDAAAWRAELLDSRRAVAAGRTAPSSHRALTTGGPALAVAARLAGVGRPIPPSAAAELAKYRPQRAAREAAVAAGKPDPLTVPCPWCRAETGRPCRSRRITPEGAATAARPRSPHPSRLDDALVAARNGKTTAA